MEEQTVQAETMPESSKASKNNKNILIIAVVAVVALVLAIAGAAGAWYLMQNGEAAQAKAFYTELDELNSVDELNAQVNLLSEVSVEEDFLVDPSASFNFSEGDSFTDWLAGLNNLAEELEQTTPPASISTDVEVLTQSLRELTTILAPSAEVFDYFLEVSNVLSNLASVDSTDADALQLQIDTFKQELSSITPPVEVVEFHEVLLSDLDKLADYYASIADYTDLDFENMTQQEILELSQELQNLPPQPELELENYDFESIFSDLDEDRLEVLSQQIQTSLTNIEAYRVEQGL